MDLNWVGTQLLVERTASRMSREALAEKSGVSLSTIRRIEEGERPGNIDQINALCEALNLPLSLFFIRAEERRQVMREEAETDAAVRDIFDRHKPRQVPTVRQRAARKDKDPDE